MLQTAINVFFIVAAIAATLSLADSALGVWQFINRSN
jgi:hypothetical protein